MRLHGFCIDYTVFNFLKKKNCTIRHVSAQKFVTLQAKKKEQMKTDNNNTLLKSRSSQACIREGYRFYMNHFRRIFRVTWPLALVFAIITAAASALPVIIAPNLLLPAVALETVAVILLLIVAGKLLRKRGVMEKTGPLKLKAWLRHLGMLLVGTIVCLFMVSILTLFTSLPTVIMMAANWESKMGVLNGDPAGMPDYVLWLSLGVFLIAGFIQAYIWMTVVGPSYMVKGSIAQQEKERNEFYKKNHEETAIVYRS